MLPEPTAVSQNPSTKASPASSIDSLQHGNGHCCDEPVFDSLPKEDVEDRYFNVESRDLPTSTPAGLRECDESLLHRLNNANGDVVPASSMSSKSHGFATGSPREDIFQSTPTQQNSKVHVLRTNPRHTLSDLPNEVLTHILSHLPPATLTTITLVSHRFHTLVTTPHAWRIAFARYFPGPGSIDEGDTTEGWISDRRSFTRLTALASWRSEYILRTRLLRSLARGKPATPCSPGRHSSRIGGIQAGAALATYTSNLLFPVSHIDALFPSNNSKKSPLFIHGAAEQGVASMSEPWIEKTGVWGLNAHQLFQHFADLYTGEAEYGLGAGDMIGLPNSMDVSQPYGMIYGEGCPQGRSYFLSSAEPRGRFLSFSELDSEPAVGIPALNMITTGVSSVWIAKGPDVLKMTDNMIGVLAGSSSGVLTAYSLGTTPLQSRRFDRGQVTAKWVLSPGVPIISIVVDDKYSSGRHSARRIWAAVLNALGEVYYLTELPSLSEAHPKASPEQLERLAWKAGRSVRWELVEATRRVARPDPFNRELVDGSYSPRSSTNSMGLSEAQISAETREIEKFLAFKPKHFRKVCEGWDMQRQLKVDFAGDDSHGAGENIFIINSGFGESQYASIRRYVRQRISIARETVLSDTLSNVSSIKSQSSLFGGESIPQTIGPAHLSPSRASSQLDNSVSDAANTEWRATNFVFGSSKSLQLTATAIDTSTFALLTVAEDPLLGISSSSSTSTPISSPLPHMNIPLSESGVPGQRSRFLAVGTDTGSIYIWNMRAPISRGTGLVNAVPPVRIIHTESPQVSCLAVTSLYLVHGGNDGLVQAWDPLASTTRPIRTLHSRFSSRARRRLIQAEASVNGVGNNYFAAGAICLDPDPTVLRGVVSLGTHVRYWSYSSSAADEYKTSKRRLRRSHRGSNSSAEGQRFNSTGRGALKDFIEDEHSEMKRQLVEDHKQKVHLSQRFGTDLLGPDATEDELLAYAQLLSTESWNNNLGKRQDSENSTVASSVSSDTVAAHNSSFPPREFSSSSSPVLETVEEELAPDIAEAIRLSLLDETPSWSESSSIPIKYGKGGKSYRHRPANSPPEPESSNKQEMDDLEFAIQLSLAEEQSREDASAQQVEEFPALLSLSYRSNSQDRSKGKGRV